MLEYRNCLRQLRSSISQQNDNTLDYMIVWSNCLGGYRIVLWKQRYPIRYCIRGSLRDIGYGTESIPITYDTCLERLLSRQWIPIALGVIPICSTETYFELYHQIHNQSVAIRNYQNQIDSVVYGNSCLYFDPIISIRQMNQQATRMIQSWRKKRMQKELMYLPPMYNNQSGVPIFPGGALYQGIRSSFNESLNSFIAK